MWVCIWCEVWRLVPLPLPLCVCVVCSCANWDVAAAQAATGTSVWDMWYVVCQIRHSSHIVPLPGHCLFFSSKSDSNTTLQNFCSSIVFFCVSTRSTRLKDNAKCPRAISDTGPDAPR